MQEYTSLEALLLELRNIRSGEKVLYGLHEIKGSVGTGRQFHLTFDPFGVGAMKDEVIALVLELRAQKRVTTTTRARFTYLHEVIATGL